MRRMPKECVMIQPRSGVCTLSLSLTLHRCLSGQRAGHKGEIMKCRKCGSADIYTDWHKSEDDCGYSSSRRFSMPKGEHLHHSCRGCHFQWSSQPLDAVGRQPEEGEAKR